jgi:hypothetical protein
MVQGLGVDGGLKIVRDSGLQGCSCMVAFFSMLMHNGIMEGRKCQNIGWILNQIKPTSSSLLVFYLPIIALLVNQHCLLYSLGLLLFSP